ncbi:MAG: hypothetical protein AAFO94_06945 [Bacteroidota bacterium]
MLSELPRQRTYLPYNFKVTVWSKLKPYFVELQHRSISNSAELQQWLHDLHELRAVVADDFSWRNIRHANDSTNERVLDAFEYALRELRPRVDTFSIVLDEKLLNSPFLDQLEGEAQAINTRRTHARLELYRKVNPESLSDIEVLSQQYRPIYNQIKVHYGTNVFSLRQAFAKLETIVPEERVALFDQIDAALEGTQAAFNQLFEQLLEKRQDMAAAAGYDNFRSFQFDVLERVDYDAGFCEALHQIVEKEVLPAVEQIDALRCKAAGKERLHTADLYAPLQAVSEQIDAQELLDLCSACLQQIHPTFGESLTLLQQHQQLDLTASELKHRGGFCVPMISAGIPYVSLHSNGSWHDRRLFMHTFGQALHSMAASHFDLNSAKRLPTELSGLSAMVLKYLSLEHPGAHLEGTTNWNRLKAWELEQNLRQLLLIAALDQFQHWVYTHPKHDRAMRDSVWQNCCERFTSKHLQPASASNFWKYHWHLIHHCFEMPFQMIEYAMTQLAAIDLWQQYTAAEGDTRQQRAANYWQFMQRGYSADLPKLYEAAGTRFDFSGKVVRKRMAFVVTQYEQLMQSAMGG